MSEISFGLVFTSGWLEVWKVENDSSGSFCKKELFRLHDDDSLENQLTNALSQSGYSVDTGVKSTFRGVFVPDNLKKALVCGITRDGSLKAAEKLAKSLLFSPEISYVKGEPIPSLDDVCCDAVIIGGGFDDSENDKIKDLILDIGDSEWFKKSRPVVIYAGNKESVATAQLKFSPFSDFYEMNNVLEEGSDDNEHNSLVELDSKNHFAFNGDAGVLDKIKLSTCSESIYSYAQWCGKRSARVMSVMINENYSVINQFRFEAGKQVVDNRAISENAGNLSPDNFSELYREFITRREAGEDDIFFCDDILPVAKKKQDFFYRPDRITGISLSPKVDVKKFLDLISDPDIIRGIIEYCFDNTGFFLMCGSFLNGKPGKTEEQVGILVSNYSFDSGWLVIPDGTYIKDEIAMEVYTGGAENDKTSQLFWGKRYVIPVKEESIIELRFKGTAFLTGTKSPVVLKSGKRPVNLVVDIRKEKS